MEKEIKFVITKSQLENLLSYLAQKPYVETFKVIDQLRALPQILDDGEEVTEKAELEIAEEKKEEGKDGN
jgi:hypothetical protein